MVAQTPIAIIGAGPSGLALARLLQVAGTPYMVYEREQEDQVKHTNISASSGTLDIHEASGQLLLKAAGLLSRFYEVARYNVPVRIVDAQGTVFADIPGEDNNDKPEIDRTALRDLLLQSVPANRIRWGCMIERFERHDDQTTSIYDRTGMVAARVPLVVGADGAFSKVRAFLTDVPVQSVGMHFFTTIISPDDARYSNAVSLAGKGNYLALGDRRQVFLHALGDQSYQLAVILKTPQEWTEKRKTHDPSELWDSLFRNAFADWSRDVVFLISPGRTSFRSWPMYSTQESASRWAHTHGITLLGDAAHLTVPSGQGVNDALFDALELARHLSHHETGDITNATARYEEELATRTKKTLEKGQWFLKHFYGAKGPGEFLEAVSHG